MQAITDRVGGESYAIRQVASLDELKEAYDLLGSQFARQTTHADRLFDDLRRCYPQDRRLMLIAERNGRIVGGVLGFENVLRIIALVPEERGKGLGRRLIQIYEVGAMRRGVQVISLGAVEDAKGFYERMGYHGKSRMQKELPLPGRVLEFRLRKLEALVGDLEVGQVVQTGEDGKVPPLF
jgi:predicted N-acetyltransferase YhbS